MTLISVLVALLLARVAEFHRESRVGGWFADAGETVAVRLSERHSGVGAALLVVLPPAVVMLIVQWLIGDWLYGLVGLILGVVVLLFALGPLDVNDVLEDYVDARHADDRERSDWYFERFTGEAVPDTAEQEGRDVVEAVLYQMHDHVFATIFWFCVLGPAGAVLYRTAAAAALQPPPGIVGHPELHRSLRFVLGLLGWIPARLVAFGYAITGSFEHAFGQLRAGTLGAADLLAANQSLLINTGIGALRGDDEIQRDEPGADGERRSHHPASAAEGARRLTWRTLALWLAVLALLTLTGWLS